ncbi:hypothetical protein [Arthrobacter sp. A2-55]|uniref:hypothetical protein n=1 Tax=Arthrobacter sp. A2-55 TaxID=2897337 RepID=UPI0021CD465E|nr:hypothetical protein [Arthrobacter sp. A2-55]MCU6480496.1 hypothetical protein [Arthrobacter sp. A2-55]
MNTSPVPLRTLITAVLASPDHERSARVDEWPADEAAAYRGAGGFQEGHAAVRAIRDTKIATDVLTVATPPIRANAWDDAADWLESVAPTQQAPERLRVWAEKERAAQTLADPSSLELLVMSADELAHIVAAGRRMAISEVAVKIDAVAGLTTSEAGRNAWTAAAEFVRKEAETA